MYSWVLIQHMHGYGSLKGHAPGQGQQMKAMQHAHTQPYVTTKWERPQVHDVHRQWRKRRTKHHHAHNVSVIHLRWWSLCWKWEVVVKSVFMMTEQHNSQSHTIYGEEEMQILWVRSFATITTAVTMATAIMTTSGTPKQAKLRSQHVRCGLTKVIRVQHHCSHEVVHTASPCITKWVSWTDVKCV